MKVELAIIAENVQREDFGRNQWKEPERLKIDRSVWFEASSNCPEDEQKPCLCDEYHAHP